MLSFAAGCADALPLKTTDEEEVCRGRSSDRDHCTVRSDNGGFYYPPAGTGYSSTATVTAAVVIAAGGGAAPNMTCPCDKAPCPNPKCPCVPGSFGCPGFDPAFDLSKVSLPGNFGDGMVLQRAVNAAAPNAQRSSVYGTATPGKQVQLTMTGPSGFTFKGETTAANEPTRPEIHGTWKVLLPAREANLRGYRLTITCAACPNSTSATVHEISFGDVWVCSGQSNMEDPVSQTFARNASFAAADSGDYDRLALFQTWWRPRKTATYILPPGGPGTTMPRQTKWHAPCGMHNCSGKILKNSINGFSAACWYFLKGLADDPSLKDIPLVSDTASVKHCTYDRCVNAPRTHREHFLFPSFAELTRVCRDRVGCNWDFRGWDLHRAMDPRGAAG